MCTDFKSLHYAFTRYLPQFTLERDTWLLICQDSCWDVLVRPAGDMHPAGALESIGDRALQPSPQRHSLLVARVHDMMCFPMMVGARPMGVVIVREMPPLTLEDRHALEAAAALSAVSIQNVRILLETRDLSVRDGLTGCFNRAHALATIDNELRRARRTRSPLSLIMFDVDRFKHVNDSHGHLAGDRVLSEVGGRLNNVLRTTDVKCRYGGDEFVLILPDTPEEGAQQLAESLREEISRIVVTMDTAAIAVTASLGVTTTDGSDLEALAFVARADAALYQSKHDGRNCVRTSWAISSSRK